MIQVQAHPATNTPETAEILQANRTIQPPGEALPSSFWQAWSWWLPAALTSVALVWYFLDPFIGDWDGIEYTMYSLWGYPSSMALGRNLFIFGNHFLWVVAHALFNVSPEQAYLLFKYAVVAQVPFAIIACWVLARDFTGSLYSAICLRMEITKARDLLRCTFVWDLFAARRRMVWLLVLDRCALPIRVVRLARVNAGGIGASSGRISESQAISDVFRYQRAADLLDHSFHAGERMAGSSAFAITAALDGRPACESALVL